MSNADFTTEYGFIIILVILISKCVSSWK